MLPSQPFHAQRLTPPQLSAQPWVAYSGRPTYNPNLRQSFAPSLPHPAYRNPGGSHKTNPESGPSQAEPADVTTLINSPFAASYAFNPLHPARLAELGASSLGFPDEFPILNDSGPQTHHALHTYLIRDISHNVALNNPTAAPIDPTTSQWALVSSTDRLTMSASLAFWSLIEQGWNPSPKMKHYCLKVQSHLISLLQDYIDCQSGPSNLKSILFAGSTQLMCVNIFGKDDHHQRQKLMDGLEQLISENGGFDRVRQMVPDSVIQNLLWTDTQLSYLNACAPRFRWVEVPPVPPSLRTCDVGDIDVAYWRSVSPDVLSIVKPLRLLMIFRQRSSHRPASHREFRYLVALFRYVDAQLNLLQARYHQTISSSECITIGLALLRLRGLTRWKDHDRITQNLLDRLEKALQIGLEPWYLSDSLSCLSWVCVVALATGATGRGRRFFLQFFLQSIERQAGPVGTEITDALPTYLGLYIMPLVWLPELDAQLDSLGVELANLLPLLDGDKSSIATSTEGESKSSSPPVPKFPTVLLSS